MVKPLFKLQWNENSSYVNVNLDGKNNKYIGVLSKESMENKADVFNFNFVTEVERLEASLCRDCQNKFELLLNIGQLKGNEHLLDTISKAASILCKYILNELEEICDLDCTVGAAMETRQNVNLTHIILGNILCGNTEHYN